MTHVDITSRDRPRRPRSSGPRRPPCQAPNCRGIGIGGAGLAVDMSHCPVADLEADLELANRLFSALPHPYLLLDHRLKARFANTAFYRAFDASPADTEGRSIHRLGNGVLDTPELRRQLGAVLTGDKPVERYEIESDFPGIGKRSMRLTAHRVPWRRGQDLILVGMLDITDCTRKQADLEKSNRNKDVFLATVCHELRTPLAAILGAVQLLECTGHEGRDDHRAHQIIERQVDHMKGLISDLLDASQVGSGRVRLDARPALLETLLERSVERVQPMLKEQSQHLELSLPAGPVRLHVDLPRLEQVICNLLANASKYSDRGTSIRLVAEADDASVTIRVVDQGIGISREQLPNVFKMFNQAPRSLHRAQGGVGIGLALVKQLVTLHGGTVEAHSEGLDRGSEFVVRLPRVAASEQASAPDAHAATASVGQSFRVLVVDDHPGVAEVSAMLLQAQGHETAVARCGSEALEQAGDLRPDVILLDVGLPDIDGREVARRIRSDQRYGNPILVAVTGYGQERDLELSRKAGFDAHLVKPIALTELESILDAARMKWSDRAPALANGSGVCVCADCRETC